MHKVINGNKIRDAIMNGELKKDGCDKEDVYQFLKLLKRPTGLIPDEEDFMEANEWKQVVSKAKNAACHQCVR